MRPLARRLLALFVIAKAVRTPPPQRERIVAEGEPARHELLIAGLLVATAAAAAVSVVGYGLGWSLQGYGGALAAALALFAVALVLAAEHLVVTEELEEEYPPDENPEASGDVVAIVRESGSRITRKRLLGGAAGLAGTALGAALVAPAVSLGPVFDTSRLNDSPWRRGTRLVDDHGALLSADDIEAGPFYTA